MNKYDEIIWKCIIAVSLIMLVAVFIAFATMISLMLQGVP